MHPPTIPLPLVDGPQVSLTHLDELWFQVTGTLCNLECRHCFISSGPHNHSFGFLDQETIRRALDESVSLGVKEYYFTGGEPFLHRDMTAILEWTLQYGPATVLTNGTVLRKDWLERLRKAEDNSPYSLEFRVSLDGFTPEENDPIRGEGTFERILHGIRLLVEHDFLPVVTVTRTRDDQEETDLVAGILKLLKAQGYTRPRLKLLPTLRIGAETTRQRGYFAGERVTPEMMEGFDQGLLLCSHSRVITDKGVSVCPILIEAPDARLGATLAEAVGPFALRHAACFTCYQYGILCANPSAVGRDS